MSNRPRVPGERDPERLGPAEVDPDAPPTAEEHAPNASADNDLNLVASLQAAWSPDALDAEAHAELVNLATTTTPRERELAAELRDALDDNEVVTVLRSAWRPAEIDTAEHRRIVTNAVSTQPVATGAKVTPLRPRAMRVAVVTTTTVLAFAASVVLWITTAAPPAELPLARARSTQPLFDEPFRAGETSARIDRIAVARASDYRDNRFAKWGVR
jgi:hypothetical protein